MATAKKKSTSFVGYGTNVKAGKKISAGVQKKVVKSVKSAGTAMGANAKLKKGTENYLGGTGIENKRGAMKKAALSAVENKLNRRGERFSKSTMYLGKTKNKRG